MNPHNQAHGAGYHNANASPGTLNPQIFQWFKMADCSQNGKLDFNELKKALKNDATSSFRAETCRMMISMFDNEGDGRINPYEFEKLWNYLAQWRQVFNCFDKDKSGLIDRRELAQAIERMGYTLSEAFVSIALSKFDTDKNGQLRFDDFIRLCCILNSLTMQFAQNDPNRLGRITIGYEQFLTMIFTSAI